MREVSRKMRFALLVAGILFSISQIYGQEGENRYVQETDPLVIEKINQWQNLKFGLLMHWGPYSQWGVVESWSICSEDEGWCVRPTDDYTEYKNRYENLQTTFNPVDFNPEKWAKAASGAGMKYVVFTTKHHDGFTMFDSKYTDYKITDIKTPFHTNPKADVTKEIFSAFRKEGMWTGAYFSKPDWHSEYYWWPYFATPDRNVNYSVKEYPERWASFVEFTHNQIMELMTGYGRVDILWLDGGWVKRQSEEEIRNHYINSSPEKLTRVQNQDIKMDELVARAREKQPGLIVVDRAVTGKNQNYLTPENRVPEVALPFPWESCIIAGGGWSWSFNAKYMSGYQAIQLLVDIVAKGGNLLLNIAPGPNGEWHEEAYRLLGDIGVWMDVNSEAIYNTRAFAPFKKGKVCVTSKGDNINYLYYMADEGEEMPETISTDIVSIPDGAKITMPGVNEELKWIREGDNIKVLIPEKIRNNPPSQFVWVLSIEKR